MLSLFDLIHDENDDEDVKSVYLDACTQLSSFAAEHSRIIENVILKIQSYLNQDKQRVRGLLVLRVLLKQCTSEIFIPNSYNWLKQAHKILQNDTHLLNKRLAFASIKDILGHSHHFPELRKQFNDISQSLIMNVMKFSVNELEVEGLECLEECMRYFPGPCGIIKSQIEAHIWKSLMKSDNENKEISSSCFALLVMCGGGGHDNVNYVLNWKNQMSRLLSTLNIILLCMFEDIEVDLKVCHPLDDAYSLPQTVDGSYTAAFKYSQYFKTVASCVEKMLNMDYPFQMNVPIENLLSVIQNILNINFQTFNNTSTILSVLISVLPSLYCSAVVMLRGLIMSCSKLLLPFGDYILRLLIQALHHTVFDTCKNSFNKPFSIVRSYLYETLNVFLLKVSIRTGLEQVVDSLIEQILLDIKPEQIVTKLQTNPSLPSKHKGCKKGVLSSDANSNKENLKRDTMANYIVCKEALKVMQALLHTSGILLKPNMYQDVHKNIVMILLDIQQNSENIQIPYNNYSCRYALYNLLLACLLNASPERSLPVQTAVSIFSVGQNDECVEIVELCAMALAVCNSIMHPQVATIRNQFTLASNGYNKNEIPRYIPINESNLQYFISPFNSLTNFQDENHYKEQVGNSSRIQEDKVYEKEEIEVIYIDDETEKIDTSEELENNVCDDRVEKADEELEILLCEEQNNSVYVKKNELFKEQKIDVFEKKEQEAFIEKKTEARGERFDDNIVYTSVLTNNESQIMQELALKNIDEQMQISEYFLSNCEIDNNDEISKIQKKDTETQEKCDDNKIFNENVPNMICKENFNLESCSSENSPVKKVKSHRKRHFSDIADNTEEDKPKKMIGDNNEELEEELSADEVLFQFVICSPEKEESL